MTVLSNNIHKGKDVFVGIDVHKKTFSITVLADHMAYPFKVGSMPACPDKFIKLKKMLKLTLFIKAFLALDLFGQEHWQMSLSQWNILPMKKDCFLIWV